MVENLTWVVGGTSGIGYAVFDMLSEEYERDAIATGHEANVRKINALREFFNEVEYPIKNIVYAAGINELMWSKDMSTNMAMEMYDVNVLGLVRVLQLAKDVERVVVLGSDAAWRPMRASGAYCASKAALHQMVQVIARERASEDFAINIVAPGMTETGMAASVDRQVIEVRNWSEEKAREYEMSQIPMGRRAGTKEIAEVVCQVLTMETPYLNGAVIPVNGARY